VLNLAFVVKGEGSWAIDAHSLVGKEIPAASSPQLRG
jgi:hypothetical protein